MHNLNSDDNRRILIIDDNPAIHEDYRKILVPDAASDDLQNAEAAFFGETAEPVSSFDVELDHAHQGEEGLERVVTAAKSGRPYAMAFVDMRMPPGWDGLTTIEHIWKKDPNVQIVICTAYSDHTWADITKRLGNNDRLLILKKPFDNSEVSQLALALTEKWNLTKQARIKKCELQRLVDQQTVQIRDHERALRQKQKLEAIGALAGGIAHEFNNLLQVINGYTSFAMEVLPSDGPVRADLAQVLGATERGASLTDQLLSFSRRQMMNSAAVDVSDLVRATTCLLRPLIGERIRLVVDDHTTGVYAECDRAQLNDALINLCNNARDAMPEGGELKVDLDEKYVESHADGLPEDVPAGDFAVITVTDTGTGMTPEVCDRVFEPFFTTKEVGEGTGLGLAMVHGCVEHLGGYITINSAPGKGTSIQLHIPAITAAPRRRADDGQGSTAHGSETILVAEDDATVRGVLERVLTHAGYSVHVTSDGEEAIRAIDEDPDRFDLLLLDVIMPEKSGVDVSDHINRDGRSIPTIYLTGYADDTPQVGELVAQEADIVLKPVNPKLLLRTVRESLDAEAPVGELV